MNDEKALVRAPNALAGHTKKAAQMRNLCAHTAHRSLRQRARERAAERSRYSVALLVLCVRVRALSLRPKRAECATPCIYEPITVSAGRRVIYRRFSRRTF